MNFPSCNSPVAMFARFFLGALIAFASVPAWASSPTLNLIMPRGVQRGAVHELVFSGARLEDAIECMLYFEGVTVEKLEQIDSNQVKVTINVAADCRLGEHVAQLRTAHGITEYRSFFVGPFPAVAEVEPNNDPGQAQVVQPGSTITGVINSEDVDRFRFTAAAGQRISAEVEAIRLGTIFIDPYLSITGPDGSVVAWNDDSFFGKQDCFVSFMAPVEGEYEILLRDAAYRGDGNSMYRLHFGNFPRPQQVFPAGARPGETLTVEFPDVAGGPIRQEVVVPAVAGRPWLVAREGDSTSPVPLPFRIVDLENVFDAEPNNSLDQTTVVKAPSAINGRLETAGDQDFFAFPATKDQVFNIQVYARQIGSPLDAIIDLWGNEKNYIAGNDDNGQPDSSMRFQIPADGTYYLRIRDHLNRGGPEFGYRIEIAPVVPTLSLTIPRVDRYSQSRQQVVIPKGNRFATLIAATRGDFGGQIRLLGENLPQGVTMHCEPMAANLTLMPVVFEAAADAPVAGGLIDFRAAHVDEATGIRGGFTNLGSFVLGEPNNADYVTCTVNRLPIAVVNPVPFRLEIVQPKAPIVREGSMSLKIVAHRDEGFTAPIAVQFPFRPPGIGATGEVVIPEGQNEVIYPLDANGGAQIGKWPIYVLGRAENNGQAWASSQLANLEIAERFVTVELQRAGCEQGRETQFVGTINQLAPFEGTATAVLLGVPPATQVEPVQFDKTATSINFLVKTAAETPAGKHTGVFCQVTINVNEEPVIATAGRSELQVDVPVVTTEAAPPPPPPPSTEKPLSRLELLREQARQAKEKDKEKKE
jgi:hypothetical protein